MKDEHENDHYICSKRTSVEKQPLSICQSSSQHENTSKLQVSHSLQDKSLHD